MKVKKRIKVIIVVVVLFIFVSLFFAWKIPIYIQLHSIVLPKECKTFKTKVMLSDVYTLHVIGERVIIIDMEQEELEDYIRSHNTEEKLRHILVFPFFRAWDDFAIVPDDYEDRVSEEDKDQYYVISYYKNLE